MRGFCSHGAVLGTTVLHYNSCATPAKLPFCKCPVQLLYVCAVKKKNAHVTMLIMRGELAHWRISLLRSTLANEPHRVCAEQLE